LLVEDVSTVTLLAETLLRNTSASEVNAEPVPVAAPE
jgi:hypothetical protein